MIYLTKAAPSNVPAVAVALACSVVTTSVGAGHALTYLPPLNTPGTIMRTVSAQREPADWLVESLARLEQYETSDYLSGYAQHPSDWTVKVASRVLREIEASGVPQPRIVPLAEGGIALECESENLSVRLDISNDEEIVGTLRSSPEAAPEYSEVSVQHAHAFLATVLMG